MLKIIKTFFLWVFLITPIILLVLYTFNTIHREKPQSSINLSKLKLVTPVAIIDEITKRIEEEDFEDALLKISAELPDPNIPSSKGIPLIVLAAEKDYTDIVGALIQKGANPDKPDLTTSETALIKAVRSQNFDTISLLLNAGANPNLGTNQGLTPLSLAIDLKNESLATLLLSSGATNGVSEENLLSYAYKKNAVGISLMLAGGIIPNITDKDNNTPLIISSANGDFESVKQLISYRANINVKNKYGMTPLLYSVKGKHWDIATYLINNGAHINSSNIYGQNVLFWAAYHGNAQLVHDLLTRGANYTKKTRKGQTALQMAKVLGHKEAAKMLEDFITYKNLPRDEKGNIILPKVNQQKPAVITNPTTSTQGVSTADYVNSGVVSEIKNQTQQNQPVKQQVQQTQQSQAVVQQQTAVQNQVQAQQSLSDVQRNQVPASSVNQTITQPAKTQTSTLQTTSNEAEMPQMPGGMDMSAVMSMMGAATQGTQNADMNAMMKQVQSMGAVSQGSSKAQIPNIPSNIEMPANMDMNAVSKMIPAGALPAGVDLNSLSSMSPEQLKKMGVPEDQISNITKAQQMGQTQNASTSSNGFQPKDLSKVTNSTYANGMVKTQINKLNTSGN